jgi:hypothetical protein
MERFELGNGNVLRPALLHCNYSAKDMTGEDSFVKAEVIHKDQSD